MISNKYLIFSLNRTNVDKTGSHGFFVSAKNELIEFFGYTPSYISTVSKVFAHKDFYYKDDYYKNSTPKLYSFGLEKAGAEIRLTSLKDAFQMLQLTETDSFVIERVEDTVKKSTTYLFDKYIQNNVIVMEKNKGILKVDYHNKKSIRKESYTFDSCYWTWDNSIDLVFWKDLLIKDVRGMMEINGSLKEVIINVFEVGEAEILEGSYKAAASKYENKKLYKIVYRENKDSECKELNANTIEITRIGELVKIYSRDKANKTQYYSEV